MLNDLEFLCGERDHSSLAGGVGVQNVDDLLRYNFSGSTITALAEQAVANCGETSLRHVNNALNNLAFHLALSLLPRNGV